MTNTNRVLKFLDPDTKEVHTLELTRDDIELIHASMAMLAAVMHHNEAGARDVYYGVRKWMNHTAFHDACDRIGDFLQPYLESYTKADDMDESKSWKEDVY